MTVPSGPICVPFVLAVIVAALAYYKIDPERRVLTPSFAFVSVPIVLLIAYLAGRVVGFDGPWFSLLAFVLALASLAAAIWHARVLLPKTQVH